MHEISTLLDKLKQRKQFVPFFHAVNKLGEKLTIREGLYSGVFCDYVADLNRGVTWDLELVSAGLQKSRITPEAGLILDICCGEGRLAYSLGQQGYSVGGVDSSSYQIERAILRENLNTGLGSTCKWKVANVLDIQSLNDACYGWDIIAAATTAASVNCFSTLQQLKAFLSSTYQLFKKTGGKVLLLPVFSDEATDYFERTFQGDVICHPFQLNHHTNVLVWTSLLYERDSRSLLQPCLVAVPNESGNLNHEFCYEVDRIWTNSEVEQAAVDEGWIKLFSLSSAVVGGGANQWPFTLLVLSAE